MYFCHKRSITSHKFCDNESSCEDSHMQKAMLYIGKCIIRNGSVSPIATQSATGKDREVYEVIRVQSGCPLFLQDHMARWRTSMSKTNTSLPEWTEGFESLIDKLIEANDIADCDIRIVAQPDGLIQCGFVQSDYPTAEMYANGVKCQLLHAERPSPELKVFHAGMRSEAAEQQHSTGTYESALVNADGVITEGSRSNIYFVDYDGRIHTAPDSVVLGGIMRKQVKQICERLGIDIVGKCVSVSEIGSYASAFLSSTPMRVLPVCKIGDTQIPEIGKANEVVARIMQAMNELIDQQLKERYK